MKYDPNTNHLMLDQEIEAEIRAGGSQAQALARVRRSYEVRLYQYEEAAGREPHTGARWLLWRTLAYRANQCIQKIDARIGRRAWSSAPRIHHVLL